MYRYAISCHLSERAITIIAFAVVSSLVAGCGANEQVDSARERERGQSASVVRYSQMGVPPSLTEASAAAIVVTADKAMVESGAAVRMVIKTATLECEVSDCDSTATKIEALVARKRGYIVSSTLRNRDAGQQTGVVTVRVPVQDFEATLAELRTLALKMESQDVRGEDVTQEFVDLTARLENKRKAERRFLEILKAAKKAPEILEIETSLMGVREEIERLEGRKRYMENQTRLCTINFVMHEPVPMTVVRTASFWSKLGNGVGVGAERGLNGIVHTASAAVALLTMGIPLVLGVVLMGWVVLKTYRRLKPRRIADEATGA